MHIGLLVDTLTLGGAERSTLGLARSFIEGGHDVTLFVVRNKNELSHELDPRIRVVPGVELVEGQRLRQVIIPLFRRLVPAMRTVDVLVASCPLTTALAVWSRPFHRRAVVTCVRFNFLREPVRPQARVDRAIRASYAQVEHLVALTQGARLAAIERTDIAPERTSVIGNIMVPACSAGESLVAQTVTRIRTQRPHARIGLMLARLVPIKRIDRALRALAHAREKGHDVEIVFAGKGPLEADLKRMADSLGLAHAAHFPGADGNPTEALAACDFLISSSSSEGFGRTLAEALQANRPVLATDCPSGPREVLRDGQFGLLCENSSAGMTEGLLRLLTEGPVPVDAKALAEHMRQYEPGHVRAQWEALLGRVTSGGRQKGGARRA